jgi:hypothetical protein
MGRLECNARTYRHSKKKYDCPILIKEKTKEK